MKEDTYTIAVAWDETTSIDREEFWALVKRVAQQRREDPLLVRIEACEAVIKGIIKDYNMEPHDPSGPPVFHGVDLFVNEAVPRWYVLQKFSDGTVHFSRYLGSYG